MSERWKPGNGETYFYVGRDFEAYNAIWLEDFPEKTRWQKGNCFRTEAEAKAAAEKVKALLLSLHSEPVTNCNQLPKLTVEVFDRPNCPEWAQYAAVNKNGLCFFYHNKPDYGVCNYAGKWYVDDCKYAALTGEKFDPSDWQNSLIERPAKLPDWCKVGEWVYHDSDGYYYKIKSIDKVNDEIQITDGESEYTYTVNEIGTLFSPARLRPYNADEMRRLVGKVVGDKDGNIYLVVCYVPRGRGLLIGGFYFNEQEIIDGGFIIDGKPCGKLEHRENGEWVE